jgi:hypothetical protein
MRLELIVLPIAFIGDFARLIVELAKSIHLIKLPITIIHAPILIEELALSMPHILTLSAFVSRALFEMLNHILQLNLLVIMILLFIKELAGWLLA